MIILAKAFVLFVYLYLVADKLLSLILNILALKSKSEPPQAQWVGGCHVMKNMGGMCFKRLVEEVRRAQSPPPDIPNWFEKTLFRPLFYPRSSLEQLI